MNPQDLKINVAPVHDSVLEFELSEDIFEGKIYQCHEFSETKDSSFLKSIYSLGEVGQVSVMPSRLRIHFTGDGAWQDFARKVGAHIRSFLEKENMDIPELPQVDQKELEDSGEIQAIKNILRTQVAPALGAHGGSVEVVNFQEGVLYLRFGGGCQGCSQISQTVKHGVEALLKRSVPTIKSIVDVTDHDQGDNPYFK